MFENSSTQIIYSNFLNVIDILGTVAFAISGAFAAIEKRLDPFGVIIIAFATSIGGGTLRDLLVGEFACQLVAQRCNDFGNPGYRYFSYDIWFLRKTPGQALVFIRCIWPRYVYHCWY